MSVTVAERARPGLPTRAQALAWGPLLVTASVAVLVWVIDPPLADMQAALAREQAAAAGAGVTYWFGWFGGISPGSYSTIVPFLSVAIGVHALLAVASVSVVALARPLARHTRHPRLFGWTVAAAAISNLLAARVAFAVGAAIAMAALLALGRRRPVLGAATLLVSGLASPLAPAFTGLGAVALLLTGGLRSTAVRSAVLGSALGVVVPLALFGAPGSYQYPSTTLKLSVAVTLCAWPALWATRQRWLPPLSIAAAALLFLVPTGVGANVGRFAYLVLPCLVVAWSTWGRRPLLLALAPMLALMTYAAARDEVSAHRDAYAADAYAPLRTALDRYDLDGYRVELVDTWSRSGSHLLGPDVMLARGWEDQSDNHYNGVLYDPGRLTSRTYHDWLSDNAVAYVAVAHDPLYRQGGEAKLARSGLTYLTQVWTDEHWSLYRVANPSPVVAAPLELREATSTRLVVDVPDTAAHQLQIRPNRYLVARSVDDLDVAACLGTTADGWVTLTAAQPGRYVLEGDFSVAGVLGADAC